MAIAVVGAACLVFMILGLLVYRAVATSTARQFDELLQQQAALALRYADHEYREGETVVPASLTDSGQPVQFDVVYQIATRSNQLLYRSPGAPLATLAGGDGPGYSNTVLEGRSWRGWQHHVTLVLLAYAFLVLQRRQRRGKKGAPR